MLLPEGVIRRLIFISRMDRGSSVLPSLLVPQRDSDPWSWLGASLAGRGLPAAAGLSWWENSLGAVG